MSQQVPFLDSESRLYAESPERVQRFITVIWPAVDNDKFDSWVRVSDLIHGASLYLGIYSDEERCLRKWLSAVFARAQHQEVTHG